MTVCDYFPFDSYRPHQKEILEKSARSLSRGDDVVIIEGPTGFGKSPVNIALGRASGSAFYTTPQTKLVNQLAGDFGPEKLAIDGGSGDVIPLLGRSNYVCRETKQDCDECHVRDDDDRNCPTEKGCTYWWQKEGAMASDVAIITFGMLVVDSYLPTVSPPVAFDDRQLLIIDECHSLEGQTASMFCGFVISPYNLPSEVWENVHEDMPESGELEDYFDWLGNVWSECNSFIVMGKSLAKDEDKCRSVLRKIGYMEEELYEGRKWVVDMGKVKWNGGSISRPEFKPIKIDRFLQRVVWSRADQIVLSSATIPFRDNPKRWLERLGLGNASYSFHTAPMTFPLENRPIITSTMGGEMTRKEENRNWGRNVRTVKDIVNRHDGDRGVIHTQSYFRAKRLAAELDAGNVFLHDKKKVDGDVVEEWIRSEKNLLLSPAVKDGVDLMENKCRYQILLKIPYPHVGDSRVSHLLDEGQWDWYMNEAAKDVVQSYGRAVRSEEDYAKFYVVDGSFQSLKERCEFPNWFTEAIQ